ncbi:hypothetical protein ACFL5V_09100 [Fibrobacterota bacterium]
MRRPNSDLGAERFTNADAEVSREEVRTMVGQVFRPEFINRLDDIIAIKPLAMEKIRTIVKLRFEDLKERLRKTGITGCPSNTAAGEIAERSYDPRYSARPILRFIQDHLEIPLSRMLLAGGLEKGERVSIGLKGEGFSFTIESENNYQKKAA